MIVPNEHDLLVKAGEFDLDSLGIIYDAYSPGLYRYASRLLGDTNLAEECVADTFARYLKALRIGHGPTDQLQAYLYRIAHNWITDFYRRHSPLLVELDETLEMADQEKPENRIIESLERQQIQHAIRMLTPDQRQVVALRFLENWTNEEVALTMQRPVGAVKALQHRALAALRSFFCSEEKVSLNEE